MNFSEQLPSKQWAALKYRGEQFAEVWFKPEGEPCVLAFRIPREGFQIPGMRDQLTMENLLKAVALVPEAVEYWCQGDDWYDGLDGANPDFKNPLPPPLHVAHLEIYVHLKPPEDAVAPSLPDSAEGEDSSQGDNKEQQIAARKWQDLDARWKAILGLEATMETFRISMEGLLTEMESAFRKSLSIEEKTYALRADVAQWERAKTRIHFALPKMKDFIHRATWAMGLPERKRLEELYKDHIQPQVPFPRMDEVLKRLEELQKDRQVLAALGKTVYQECKGISAEIQGALRTLQNNAANVQRKKGAGGSKGRFFK